MKAELQKKLFERFEFLRNSVSEQTRGLPFHMFGVEVGSGWYDLLYKLFEGIEAELSKPENAELKKVFMVSQLKEKFGQLRIYCWGSTEKIEKLIEEAEEKSETICEDCGAIGENRSVNGWYRTQCDKCRTQDNKKWDGNIDEKEHKES